MRPIRVQLVGHRTPALPNASQRALLRAALLEGDEASAAWAQWRLSGGGIDSVDRPTFRLLPLVCRNLVASGVDDPDLPRLRGVYRHAWVGNQRLAHRVGPALGALSRAGVPTMLMKGAAVCVAHYRDLGARPMDDVDVLVSPNDARLALSVLQASGWSLVARIDPARVLRSLHATTLTDSHGSQIDLHWRAFQESARDDDFWSAAIPAEFGGARTLVPGPTEQLLHTCAHGVRPSPAPLRWIADAHVIVRSAGASIDWPRFIRGVAARRVSLRTAVALDVLVDLLGTAVPHQVIADLRALPPSPRERLILQLARRPMPLQGHIMLWDLYRRQIAAEDSDLAPPGFLQYLADEHDLPSRAALGPMLARRAASGARVLLRATPRT